MPTKKKTSKGHKPPPAIKPATGFKLNDTIVPPPPKTPMIKDPMRFVENKLVFLAITREDARMLKLRTERKERVTYTFPQFLGTLVAFGAARGDEFLKWLDEPEGG